MSHPLAYQELVDRFRMNRPVCLIRFGFGLPILPLVRNRVATALRLVAILSARMSWVRLVLTQFRENANLRLLLPDAQLPRVSTDCEKRRVDTRGSLWAKDSHHVWYCPFDAQSETFRHGNFCTSNGDSKCMLVCLNGWAAQVHWSAFSLVRQSREGRA